MTREMIVALLVNRIKSDAENNVQYPLTVDQVPEAYREEVNALVSKPA